VEDESLTARRRTAAARAAGRRFSLNNDQRRSSATACKLELAERGRGIGAYARGEEGARRRGARAGEIGFDERAGAREHGGAGELGRFGRGRKAWFIL
jgi:hypothetical protein